MAYMNQDRKAVIAAAIKPVLAKYGVKGSLSVRNHSTICLTVTSGVIDFGEVRSVNVYWIERHHQGVVRDFLLEALAALRSAGWYDRSDAMTDYFDTAYYVDISIGRWNKPYIWTPARVAA